MVDWPWGDTTPGLFLCRIVVARVRRMVARLTGGDFCRLADGNGLGHPQADLMALARHADEEPADLYPRS